MSLLSETFTTYACEKEKKTEKPQTRYYLYFQVSNGVLRNFHNKGKCADKTDLKIKRFNLVEVQIPQQHLVFQTWSQQKHSMLMDCSTHSPSFPPFGEGEQSACQLFRASRGRTQEEALSRACWTHRTASPPRPQPAAVFPSSQPFKHCVVSQA